MSQQTNNCAIAVIGIDIGKNSFHILGHDPRGAMVLRQKWSRCQVETQLANLAPCLIGMEACVGAHHLSRKLQLLGHNARLMPAKYAAPIARDRRTTSMMPKLCGARRRSSSRPRRRTNLTCRPCTASASAWSVSVPASSIRSAPSCWSGAPRYGRDCVSCGSSCRASWRHAPMFSRPACRASSRS
jgi:hypothetical protein